MRKKILLFIGIGLSFTVAMAQTTKHLVNLSGNSYVVEERGGATISNEGLTNWEGEGSKINTFVYFSKPQTIVVSIKGNVAEGKSVIKLSANGESRLVELNQGNFETLVGNFEVKTPGYVPFSFEGVSKSGKMFASVESLIVETDDDALVYVHDFSDYWGRRGPSV
ncbi:MAG: DUF5077 domain-containing protein, partial [Bacteroidales bacterium]|nr:DUF5077 domain-containing protein [Bacteroidales bacterium]